MAHGTRAKGKVRRWCRHFAVRYMWTLTFARAETDYLAVAQAVDQFLRRLAEVANRKETSRQGAPPPRFLLVAEPHPGGHGWHVHGATDRWLAHGLVARLWGRGHVWVSGPGPRRSHWPVRALARYVAKYVAKEVGGDELHGCDPRPPGAHRYWHTEDRLPSPLRRRFATLQEALDWIRGVMGPWDVIRPFGDAEGDPIYGYWLSFPDESIRRWQERVKADSRAQRGQP